MITNINDTKIYGLSQNPDTKNYIMVLYNEYLVERCVKCDKIYTDEGYKWCRTCQINNLKENFTNWTSGNKKIDNFIQEIQLKINNYNDIVFEWVPYNQFDDIEEISNHCFAIIYSGKWKDGPLEYNENAKKYERNPNRKTSLKSFQNISNINKFLDEV